MPMIMIKMIITMITITMIMIVWQILIVLNKLLTVNIMTYTAEKN